VAGRPHPLTKVHWLAGLQCARRLWLAEHAPELAAPLEPDVVARRELGRELGVRARALFPAGVAVDDALPAALDRTRALLADPAVPAVFEAAFEHDGVAVRVDVLERLPGGGFGIREVKSGTNLRREHLEDAALQRVVAEACGVDLRSVEIVLVDREYVREPGDVDWRRLFRREDVTDAVADVAAAVPSRREAFRATLALGDAPVVEPSPHCSSPRRCEFWSHCTRARPADWVMRLPGLARNQWAALHDAGIERIGDIPDDWWLTGPQSRAWEAARSGRPVARDELADVLRSTGPPASYLDFEAIAPAVPFLVGARPYQAIPFQWSLHRDDGAEDLGHAEFLADGVDDPRRAFVESLLAATVGSSAPILVYSPYESRVLADLALVFPEHADALAALQARLVDLLPMVYRHVYLAGFAGSFSLKQIAPVLSAGFRWEEAGIAHGAMASSAFADLRSGRVAATEATRLRAALRTYCATDTRALVEVHRALRTLARGSG
jgi:hypothetical protein